MQTNSKVIDDTIFVDGEESLVGKVLKVKIDAIDEKIPLVKIIEKIGSGGMCDVYRGEIDIYMYRAKRIIEGTLEPEYLGSELRGISEGKITDAAVAKRVLDQAVKWGASLKKIFKEEKSRDTSKIVQQKLMADTNKEFRAKGNEVAVKVLKPIFSNPPPQLGKEKIKKAEKVRNRFIKESNALKKFNHPNLVRSIEAGHDRPEGAADPVYFYIMEYTDAYDLDQHDEDNPLDVTTAVKIAKCTLKACDYIHNWGTEGVWHRDIKPSNILVDKETINEDEIDARLSDLGFAKIREEEESSSSDVTQSQEVAGTPSYMAPEQSQGLGAATKASDIWSIAATLYTLLTGHPPYEVDGNAPPVAVLSKILECKPPARIKKERQHTEFIQMLDDIVLLNFTKIQEKRLDAKEFIAALEEYEFALKNYLEKYTSEEWNQAALRQEIAKKEAEQRKNKIQPQELTAAYYVFLNTLEREEKFEGSQQAYNQGIVKERVKILEKLVALTEDEHRKGFLKKYIDYEKSFLIKKEESQQELPRKRNTLRVALMVAGTLLLGAATGFGIWYKQTNDEKNRVNSEIVAKIQSGESTLKNAQNEQQLAQIARLLSAVKEESKEAGDNGSIDVLISQLEQNYNEKKKEIIIQANDAVCSESQELIQNCYAAIRQRKFSEAQEFVNNAERRIQEVRLEQLDDYEAEKEKYRGLIQEVKKEVENIRAKLADKEEGIRVFTFVKQGYERINGSYEELKKKVDSGDFPDKEEIPRLLKNITIQESTLWGIEDEYLDEKGKPMQEHTDLQSKIEELKRKIDSLSIDLAKKQFRQAIQILAEIQKINIYLSNNYLEDDAAKKNEQANSLHTRIKKLIQNTESKHVDFSEYEEYATMRDFEARLAEIEASYTQTSERTTYYSAIKKKASEGDQTALLELGIEYFKKEQPKKAEEHLSRIKDEELIKTRAVSSYLQIISLERIIADESQQIYIRDGITSDYINSYKKKVESYLRGENYRAETEILSLLAEIQTTLPQYTQSIDEIIQKTNLLFLLSKKIDSLKEQITEKPDDAKLKEEYEQALSDFSKKAQAASEPLLSIYEVLKKYISEGTRTIRPDQYLSLGQEYETIEYKEKAIAAYKKFLEAAQLGFSVSDEKIRLAEERIDLLEQK